MHAIGRCGTKAARNLRRGTAAAAVAATLFTAATELRAQSASLDLRGVARPMASLEISGSEVEIPGDLAVPYSGPLITIVERSNATSGYVLSLEVASAARHGRPALDAGEGGASVPYALYYGEREVRFERGRALLADEASPGATRRRVLSIRTDPSRPVADRAYRDTIRLTVAAR
jgi:hypothetical protein